MTAAPGPQQPDEAPPTVEQATRDAIVQVRTVQAQLHSLALAAITAADSLALLAEAHEDDHQAARKEPR